jgi:hypothetical protein
MSTTQRAINTKTEKASLVFFGVFLRVLTFTVAVFGVGTVRSDDDAFTTVQVSWNEPSS